MNRKPYSTVANRPKLAQSITFVLVSLLVAGIAISLARPNAYTPYAEGIDYVRMAHGKYSTAYFYYAGRILHPWLAGMVGRIASFSIDDSFRWIAVSLVPILVLAMTYPFRHLRVSYQFVGGILFLTPSVIGVIYNYYFQDLLFVTLIAIFLLVVSRNVYLAGPVVFLLGLTRELSGLLVGTAIILLSVRRKYLAMLLMIICYLPALVVVRRLISRAVPNKHGVGVLTMDLLKIPWNASRNLLGVTIWTDTNKDTSPCVPRVIREVARYGVGHITEVGVCDWEPQLPLSTLELVFTSFGILPLAGILRHRLISKSCVSASDAWRIACGYGLGALILTPLQGTWLSRYIVYALPLFWAIAKGAMEWASSLRVSRLAITIALCGHAFIAWLPWIVHGWASGSLWQIVAIDATTAAAYVGLYLAIRSFLRRRREAGFVAEVPIQFSW